MSPVVLRRLGMLGLLLVTLLNLTMALAVVNEERVATPCLYLVLVLQSLSLQSLITLFVYPLLVAGRKPGDHFFTDIILFSGVPKDVK